MASSVRAAHSAIELRPDGTLRLAVVADTHSAPHPKTHGLLKAYAPRTIYVSRIVALEPGEAVEISFGLPDRIIENPTVANPSVAGLELAMTVRGSDLDGNYTLFGSVVEGQDVVNRIRVGHRIRSARVLTWSDRSLPR